MDERDLREIADNIAVLIDSRNDALIRNITVDLHPADLADILHHLKDDDRDYMFGLLDVDVASDVMPELDDVSRDDILEDLQHDRLTEIVDEMDLLATGGDSPQWVVVIKTNNPARVQAPSTKKTEEINMSIYCMTCTRREGTAAGVLDCPFLDCPVRVVAVKEMWRESSLKVPKHLVRYFENV